MPPKPKRTVTSLSLKARVLPRRIIAHSFHLCARLTHRDLLFEQDILADLEEYRNFVPVYKDLVPSFSAEREERVNGLLKAVLESQVTLGKLLLKIYQLLGDKK